jgi:hypothetical protein
MAIIVPCPCGKSLQVDEQYRGKKAKCPACGNVLVVEETPVAAVETVAPEQPPEPAPKPRPPLKRKQAGWGRPVLWLAAGGCALAAVCVCTIAGGVGSGVYYARNQAELLRAEEAEKERIARERREHQRASINNLKQISLALHDYHDVYKHFPFYATVHPQTQQMHLSWRVLLLPYLDENPLYLSIHLDEPWDSKHNQQFWTKIPRVYQLPGKPSDGKTYYQVFFGPGATFSRLEGNPPRPAGINVFGMVSTRYRLFNMPDGTSNTIFALEAADPVNWMKPEDIPFQVKADGTPTKVLGNHWGDDTVNIAFFDAAVLRMRRAIPPVELQKMVGPDDGLAVNPAQWEAGPP